MLFVFNADMHPFFKFEHEWYSSFRVVHIPDLVGSRDSAMPRSVVEVYETDIFYVHRAMWGPPVRCSSVRGVSWHVAIYPSQGRA